MHTDMQQLFLLIQIPPTVDKYTDIYIYLLNHNNFLLYDSNHLTVLIVMGLFYSFAHVGLSAGVSNTAVKF